MGKTETVPFDEVNAARLRLAIEREPQLLGMLQSIHGKVIVGIVVRDLDYSPVVAEPVPEAENVVVDPALVPSAKAKRARGRK